MVDVSVRPMTPTEFDVWQRQLAEAYAEHQVEAGNWAPDEALQKALDSNAELLPDGIDTDDTLLLMGTRPDGSVIGRLWISLTHPRGAPDCAFLYDIEVEEAHRGHGYGRALLTAAEEAVTAHGVGALELNVFGYNSTAISLYGSAGYTVTTQQMRKRLSER